MSRGDLLMILMKAMDRLKMTPGTDDTKMGGLGGGGNGEKKETN